MTKILLTGGSGMVGRNIVENIPPSVQVYAPSHAEMDLLNQAKVTEVLNTHRVDMIIHAAGSVGGIHTNMSNLAKFMVENWNMGQNIIMGARRCGITRLINLGSSCMYPKTWSQPLKEEDILSGSLEPTNEGYAIAKSAVARLGQYIYNEDSSFQYKTIIPCNLYGKYDSFQHHKSHLIPAIIHKLHRAKIEHAPFVTIWGDGTVRRESLFATDLAQLILHAIDNFDTMPLVMNAGAGEDYTVNEYYHLAQEVIGFNGTFRHDSSKPVGVRRKLIDSSRAHQWGWRATTPLKEGLRTTYQWYLNHVASSA